MPLSYLIYIFKHIWEIFTLLKNYDMVESLKGSYTDSSRKFIFNENNISEVRLNRFYIHTYIHTLYLICKHNQKLLLLRLHNIISIMKIVTRKENLERRC